MKCKTILDTAIGVVGALLYFCFGDLTVQLTTLIWVIVIDFITGLLVASVFKTSPKTKSGALSSSEMLKGFVKKLCILILVAVAYRLDIMLGTNYLKNATTIALISEELLSIIENVGLMGLPIPSFINSAIDVLNQKVKEMIN